MQKKGTQEEKSPLRGAASVARCRLRFTVWKDAGLLSDSGSCVCVKIPSDGRVGGYRGADEIQRRGPEVPYDLDFFGKYLGLILGLKLGLGHSTYL